MKKVFYIIGLLLLSLLAGYGVGYLISYIIDGGEDVGHSIDKIKMAKAIVTAFVALIIGIFANLILHEAGHLVGGLLTGYKFLSFRIFNFTLQKEDDGWHWKKFGLSGTAGQCLMSPPHTAPMPYFWYNVGGVMANLIIIIISAILLYFIDLSAVTFSLYAMFLWTGIWILITNGIPMTIGGIPNDGKNILTLWRHPDQLKHFHNMLAVAAEQSQGNRVGEMPEEWFESSPLTHDSTVMEMSARTLAYSRLMDEFRFDEARTMAEELMALGKSLPSFYQKEVAGDLLLLELVTLNRIAVVDELWNKTFDAGKMTLQKYIEIYRKYIPMKNAILYVYELINNQSPESAQQYYDEVKSKQNTYTQPGEARTALAIMDKVGSSYCQK